MASEDDDIGLSLPQPPRPAPARREAAISEALRRFDAEGDAPRVAPARREPQRAGPWWGRANRPQLGVMVAASLVALIGLPVAWLTISQNSMPAPELASRQETDLKSFDVAEEAPRDSAANTPRSPAIAFEPRLSTPPAELSANRGEERASETAPSAHELPKAAQALAAGEAKRADNAAHVGNQTMLARAPRAPAAIMATAPPSPAAPPAVAPPPMVIREAPAATKPKEDLAAADTDSIVVTSARRRGITVPDRGDWNACTINDPKRSLAACKYLVDSGAKGIKGQAAAHLADGLSLAWQGNMDRAIAAFDRTITIAPKSSLAYLNRGLAYQRQGDTDRALADLDRAVRFAPGAARSYYNRSLLLRERGDAKRADADQARAINLDAEYEAVIN